MSELANTRRLHEIVDHLKEKGYQLSVVSSRGRNIAFCEIDGVEWSIAYTGLGYYSFSRMRERMGGSNGNAETVANAFVKIVR